MKDTYIRIRIGQQEKEDFETICAELQTTPSTEIRSTILKFNQKHRDNTKRFSIHITQPDGFEYGVWKVIVRLRNKMEGTWGGSQIAFLLPDLPKRRIESEPEYKSYVYDDDNNVQQCVQFIDGVWRGYIRSNGIAEDENPTTINKVEEELIKIVTDTLKNFHG